MKLAQSSDGSTARDTIDKNATEEPGRDGNEKPGPEGPRKNGMLPRLAAWGPSLAVLVGAVLAWEFLPRAFDVPEFILPPLSEVLRKFTNWETLSLYGSNALVTLQEAVIGLLIGAVLGVAIGFVLGTSPGFRRAMYPYVIALQSLPKVAVAPLFVIWFGFGLTPKILVVVLLTFFPVLVNTMSGVMNVDKQRIDLFRSIGANKSQTWRKLLLPSSMPSIFAGFEVAAVMSLLGAITAEFVSAEAGLGLVLRQQQNNYDTAGVFAVLMILSLMGIIINQTVRQARRRVLAWNANTSGGNK